MSLAHLFPDQDYEFQLRFERGEPAQYFDPSSNRRAVIAERARWLRSDPVKYSAFLPRAGTLLDDAIDLARSWHGFSIPRESASGPERLIALGEFWEPDFLLLSADQDQKIRLWGGCVCFPSSWRLTEKIGHPMEFIHGPVPGLNDSIGASVHRFLLRLKPGVAWQRLNWGLTASSELNQHPDRGITPLDSATPLDSIWLRVEHQALIALPRTEGILFGIRIAVHALSEVRADPIAALRLRRALQTMPEAVARYKGILNAKQIIIKSLSG